MSANEDKYMTEQSSKHVRTQVWLRYRNQMLLIKTNTNSKHSQTQRHVYTDHRSQSTRQNYAPVRQNLSPTENKYTHFRLHIIRDVLKSR